MNGEQLRALRQRRGWSQNDAARLLNEALGRKMTRADIGKFENGKRPIPKPTSEFLDRLAVEDDPEQFVADNLPPLDDPAAGSEDSIPPPPPGVEQTAATVAALVGGGSYARICEELFELVATGVGMVGAVTGNDKLRQDGQIILADKAALGKAYGKLAEQNATFRNMLIGMSGGGAWLEVALVSGITAGKVMRNHQAPRPVVVPPEPDEVVSEPGVMHGDGAVVHFPA